MRPRFDLQFFGGGSKTTTVRKRDPNPWLEHIQAQLNNIFSTTVPNASQIYNDMQDARAWADAAKERQWGLMNAQQGLVDSQKALLGQTTGFLNQLPGQMKNNQSLLNEMMGVVRSGNIPSGVMDQMNAAVNKGLQTSMGSMLNNLAGRGVVNSTITSKGISDLSSAAADARRDLLPAAGRGVAGVSGRPGYTGAAPRPAAHGDRHQLPAGEFPADAPRERLAGLFRLHPHPRGLRRVQA